MLYGSCVSEQIRETLYRHGRLYVCDRSTWSDRFETLGSRIMVFVEYNSTPRSFQVIKKVAEIALCNSNESVQEP